MRTLFIILVTVFIVQACGSRSVKPPVTATDPGRTATQFIAAGKFLRAAEEYLRLAELYPNQSVQFQLNAAEAFINAGDFRSASTLLGNPDLQTPATAGFYKKQILLARIALENNLPTDVLTLLGRLNPENIPQPLIITFHDTRAKAYEMQGKMSDAGRERIVLSTLLVKTTYKQANYNLIWKDLNQLDLPALTRLLSASTGVLTSWIELAIINQSMLFKPDFLEQELAIWMQQYPGHAAIPLITGNILQASRLGEFHPDHIALCLPFTGRYKAVSEAIRDGLLAAWYNSEDYQPSISIYDANSLNIIDVYQTAIAEGADFVVGPLEKPAIGRLLEAADLTVNILALNQFGITETTNIPAGLQNHVPALVQFGLLPEDEARQVAAQAIYDGRNRALVINRDDNLGERLYHAFRDQWTAMGGKILGQINYQQETRDFSTPVKRLLNISSSERRAGLLQQRLNRRILSESRIREDADMIFMAARPEDARQIVPQLRFHRADHIPVYSTSRIYSGIINPQLDNDINDVMFTDFPWILAPSMEELPVQQSINRNWAADRSLYNRFYAFGVDAFHLIPHISRLTLQRTVPFPGVTGDLYMTGHGTIQRKLLWARFTRGIPEILDPGALH